MIAKANAATATGAITSAASGAINYFGLSQSEWSIVGIWFGMALGFAGYITSLYFQRKNLQINEKRSTP